MAEENVPNAFGKESSLRIVAGRDQDRTYLKELSFTAPFKVMSPFQQPDGGIKVMPLTASAGIMEGDRQVIHIETKPHTKLEYVSQSYEKIHKMNNGNARRETCLRVGSGSLLLYRPLPVIPFEQSAFDSRTEIQLEDAAGRLFYQEILACGRVAGGERFGYRYYHTLVEACRCGRMIYRENCRFHPAMGGMEETGLFEGYSYLANILIFHTGADIYIDAIRSLIDKQADICGGVTLTADSDIVVRMLSKQVQNLQQMCDMVYKQVMSFIEPDP